MFKIDRKLRPLVTINYSIWPASKKSLATPAIEKTLT